MKTDQQIADLERKSRIGSPKWESMLFHVLKHIRAQYRIALDEREAQKSTDGSKTK